MRHKKPLEKHTFVFNPEENGGESLALVTEFFSNGDPGVVYSNQQLTLHSYGNSASINLYGSGMLPQRLRQLADELEKARHAAIIKTEVQSQIIETDAIIVGVDDVDRLHKEIVDANVVITTDGHVIKNRFGHITK